MSRRVLIVMASDSDLEAMTPAVRLLKELRIEHDVRVASAYRTPDRAIALARGARQDGFGVIIAASGGAAHLAGVLAAQTTLPVVAVPMATGALAGFEALLSAAQMPSGVPVASVGVGAARNAALFAAQILGAADENIAAALDALRAKQEAAVLEADARVKTKLEAVRS
ncbi:MAG: 5-(carboxyamino)imidazole ribonucleotide mutase [Deltaproteobacteria bacterium]|nr:5-(carboxyamino)imidazole ribonucleotide mutase [Deltaproteobacteria bacterium]